MQYNRTHKKTDPSLNWKIKICGLKSENIIASLFQKNPAE